MREKTTVPENKMRVTIDAAQYSRIVHLLSGPNPPVTVPSSMRPGDVMDAVLAHWLKLVEDERE